MRQVSRSVSDSFWSGSGVIQPVDKLEDMLQERRSIARRFSSHNGLETVVRAGSLPVQNTYENIWEIRQKYRQRRHAEILEKAKTSLRAFGGGEPRPVVGWRKAVYEEDTVVIPSTAEPEPHKQPFDLTVLRVELSDELQVPFIRIDLVLEEVLDEVIEEVMEIADEQFEQQEAVINDVTEIPTVDGLEEGEPLATVLPSMEVLEDQEPNEIQVIKVRFES